MIRYALWGFAVTLCVLYAPIIAIICGCYLLYRTYPRR
jgi:hypothetical protein